MIVLKNLSKEFNTDPYPLRMKLRKEFGKRARWRWDEAIPQEANELKKVRDTLKKWIEGKRKSR